MRSHEVVGGSYGVSMGYNLDVLLQVTDDGVSQARIGLLSKDVDNLISLLIEHRQKLGVAIRRVKLRDWCCGGSCGEISLGEVQECVIKPPTFEEEKTRLLQMALYCRDKRGKDGGDYFDKLIYEIACCVDMGSLGKYNDILKLAYDEIRRGREGGL